MYASSVLLCHVCFIYLLYSVHGLSTFRLRPHTPYMDTYFLKSPLYPPKTRMFPNTSVACVLQVLGHLSSSVLIYESLFVHFWFRTCSVLVFVLLYRSIRSS